VLFPNSSNVIHLFLRLIVNLNHLNFDFRGCELKWNAASLNDLVDINSHSRRHVDTYLQKNGIDLVAHSDG
jgi:hypothetical protein